MKVYKPPSKNKITRWKNRQKMTFLPHESPRVRTAEIPVRRINSGMLQIKIVQVRNCSVQIRTNRILTVTVHCQIRSQLPTVTYTV